MTPLQLRRLMGWIESRFALAIHSDPVSQRMERASRELMIREFGHDLDHQGMPTVKEPKADETYKS